MATTVKESTAEGRHSGNGFDRTRSDRHRWGNGLSWIGTCALAACLGATFGGGRAVPSIEAQSSGEPAGQYIMATGSTTDGRTEVYILDISEHKLGTYQSDQIGIRLRGVRDVRYDLKVEEINPKGQRLSVEAMRKLHAQQSRGGVKAAGGKKKNKI